jgi:CrcB protein
MVRTILITGLGGFIGTILRFLVSRYFQLNLTTVFPWGTFLVNIIGCFLIGIFLGISEKGDLMSTQWRIFFTVGICGGFTTFSSFSNDAFILLQNREMLRFVLYTGLSFILGIFSLYLGRILIKIL